MSRSINITLAGKDYIVPQLRTRPASAWRTELNDKLGVIVDSLRSVSTARGLEITDLGSMADMVDKLRASLLGSIDTVTELLFSYSRTLREHQDEILDPDEGAYDDEIIDAFVAVLRLAFPFEKVASMFRGPSLPQTGQN